MDGSGIGHSILIVEDDPGVASDLQQSLQYMGYDAYAIASSADEAIQRASDRCPDLVLMDMTIGAAPEGIQLADILRHKFGVSVVYLTAHADEAIIEEAKQIDPDGYLQRPIKVAELRAAIEVAVHKHRLDKSLRECEGMFSTALRSVSDAVVTLDLSGKVTLVNPAAETLIGTHVEAALGRSSEDLLWLMDQAIPTAEASPQPVARLVARGADAGKPAGAVKVLRSISEKVQLQKQLKLADRLTSLGTMAASTAHELNNPLTVVVTNAGFIGAAFAEHIAEHFPDGKNTGDQKRLREIQEAIGDLNAAASRMGRIVADLRTFSQPAEQTTQTIDLRRCIERAIRATAHEFQDRARLRTRFDATPEVRGETARLEQVLVNLLINAAHAIAPGDAERNEVSISTRTDDRGFAIIDIRDTGEGMAPAVLERIFEPFFTTKPAGTGTGLGLAICSGIVKSLGGEIRATSDRGRGTTFTLSLPAASSQKSAAPKTAGAESASATGRILVVDDEPTLLRAMQRILEDEKHHVVCVDNAHDAIVLINRGEQFDVILSDLLMPTMTGVDLYEALLLKDRSLAESIVFVSGGATTAKLDGFLRAARNLRLEKPFKGAQLLAIVQRALLARAAVTA